MSDATRPYRPSNGTEGDMFLSSWCSHCERDRSFREDSGDGCEISLMTMAVEIDHPEYPREWVTGPDGPRCTAFVTAGNAIAEARCDRTPDLFAGSAG